MTGALVLPEKDEDSLKDLERLRTFEVKTNDDYRELDRLCILAKDRENAGEKLYRDSIDDAHKTHKGLVSKLKSFVGPSQEVRRIAKGKMYEWDQAQEKERARKERELQDQAKKLAEERVLADAELAERAGDHAEAEAILTAPIDAVAVCLPKSTPKAATIIRKIPDLEKIRRAVDQGVREITGVEIKAVWTAKVIDSQKVPDQYRRVS